MPAYVWKGKNREGKAVSGERVAESKEAVMTLLRRDQILVSSVKEKGKEMALPKFGGGGPAKQLAIFTRQFSVMIDAGLPLVLCIAGLVIAVILWKVIPTFASMFEGLGAQLPLPTRIVIALSNWFVRLLPFLVVFIVGFIFAFKRYYATYGGRRVVDRMVLKMPIIGILMQKIAVARFCRTLATLISSGVPILDGLEITARTSGNAIIEDAIMMVRKAVESGLTIAQPLKDSGVFPAMVVQMIGVGEQTGALDAMLSKIADFYEEEVDQAVANLLTLMEPVMIMFLGITVGGIVISMYLPLFDLISKLS